MCFFIFIEVILSKGGGVFWGGEFRKFDGIDIEFKFIYIIIERW